MTRSEVLQAPYRVLRQAGSFQMTTATTTLGRFRIHGEMEGRWAGRLLWGRAGADQPVLLSVVPANMAHAAAVAADRGLRVMDLGTLPTGEVFFAYDVPFGETLAQRLRRGPLGWRSATLAFLPVLSKLLPFHERDEAYARVAPASMIVRPDGTLAIVGRELHALRSAFNRRRDAPGVFSMDLAPYLAPECTRGEAPTPASDVFALGAVLFEAITGHRAFEAGNVLAVLHRVQTATVPALRTQDPSVPEALSTAVAVALQREPDRRPSLPLLIEALAVSRRAARGTDAAPPPQVAPRPSTLPVRTPRPASPQRTTDSGKAKAAVSPPVEAAPEPKPQHRVEGRFDVTPKPTLPQRTIASGEARAAASPPVEAVPEPRPQQRPEGTFTVTPSPTGASAIQAGAAASAHTASAPATTPAAVAVRNTPSPAPKAEPPAPAPARATPPCAGPLSEGEERLAAVAALLHATDPLADEDPFLAAIPSPQAIDPARNRARNALTAGIAGGISALLVTLAVAVGVSGPRFGAIPSGGQFQRPDMMESFVNRPSKAGGEADLESLDDYLLPLAPAEASRPAPPAVASRRGAPASPAAHAAPTGVRPASKTSLPHATRAKPVVRPAPRRSANQPRPSSATGTGADRSGGPLREPF